MPHAFTSTRRVEFSDTDMAGIAHFANFFPWMESAEHAFLRSLGLSVHGELDGVAYGFVRAHASCDYRRPVRYQDLLEIELTVVKKSRVALVYEFVFRVLDSRSTGGSGRAEDVANGRLEVVCVGRPEKSGERVRAIDIPELIARRVDVAPS